MTGSWSAGCCSAPALRDCDLGTQARFSTIAASYGHIIVIAMFPAVFSQAKSWESQ